MKRMKKVDIIARAEQLEDLKEALNRIGIQGDDGLPSIWLWIAKRAYRSLSWARVCGQSCTNGEG